MKDFKINSEEGHKKVIQELVKIPAGQATLEGNLNMMEHATKIVLFAHGSGSSRFSPRNQYVARVIQDGYIATLLIDLLTAEEEAVDIETQHLRFDIGLLAERLIATIDWLTQNSKTKGLTVGLFGASTGTAAALIAASKRSDIIAAIVSRGGRPDLAESVLPLIKAPTLLIVGGNDIPIININREAFERIQTTKNLIIVPSATHLFEEPGALERVAQLAADWFKRYLTARKIKYNLDTHHIKD